MKRLILAVLLLTSLGCMRTASVMGQGAVMPQMHPLRTATGAVASGYKLCFFATGTTTAQAVYSNRTLVTAITQPITLDAGGYPSVNGSRVQIFYQPLGYKVTLHASGTVCSGGGANMSSANWTIDPSFDYGQEIEAAVDAVPTITQGRYTPTLAGVANVAAITGGTNYFMYTRINTHVHVSGQISVDPTAAAPTGTSFTISVPIASAFSGGIIDGHGVGSSQGIDSTQSNFACYGDDTANAMLCTYYANDTDLQTYQVSFDYLIN